MNGWYGPGASTVKSPTLKAASGLAATQWGFQVAFEHRFFEVMPLYLGLERVDLSLHLSEHHGNPSRLGRAVFISFQLCSGSLSGAIRSNVRAAKRRSNKARASFIVSAMTALTFLSTRQSVRSLRLPMAKRLGRPRDS